jgi:universal stress protein A
MLMPTRILVPTDFSQYSDRALRQALDIAKEYHAKVFLLHVMDERFYGPVAWTSSDLGLSKEMWRQVKDRHRAEMEEKLQDQLHKFPQAEEVETVANVRLGIPYEEILKEGKEKGIDLIVIASLGSTGMAKYLIGGVARNVLKGSKCPVLLVK